MQTSSSDVSAIGQQPHVVELQKLNARELYPVLKALAFNENCILMFNHDGLQVTVEDQNEQCNCFLQAELFSDYEAMAMAVTGVEILQECLNVFSGQSAILKAHYDVEGEPLVMNVEDEGIVYTCSIKTLVAREILDFEFDNLQVMGRVVLTPNSLRNIIRELDATATSVKITLTQEHVVFNTDGDLGKTRIRIPGRSEQVEELECIGVEMVQYQYRILQVKRMLQAVALCNKVSLRIDHRGVLSAQFVVPMSERQNVFINFYCVSDHEHYMQQNEEAA